MAEISDILDGPSSGGVTYYDESQDKPRVPMPEGSYPCHITSVDTAVRTVKKIHQALIYNVKVKIAEPCDAHSTFQAVDYDGNKCEVNGGDFAGKEMRSNGIFKFLHPGPDDEFEANPGGNKGYANFCTVVGKEPKVKEIEHNGEMVSVKELPDLVEEDILGRPVIAVIAPGKPWKSDRDGKVRTTLEVKWFRNWADGEIIDLDAEDLPF
tara:strand:- start:60 stop:689 length:630 start_codon:yes stop_codon:yes gene_type:complete